MAVLTDQTDAPNRARRDAALRIVRRYVATSGAIGIIPIPGLDVTLLAGVHIAMIKSLTEHYGSPFTDAAARNILLVVGASLLPATVGSVASRRFLRLLPPGLSTIAQVASSGATSYALGRVMMAHFETGGTLDSFDVRDIGKLMWWRASPERAMAPVIAS